MQLNVFALLATALAAAPAFAQLPSPSVLNYDTLFDNPNGSLGSTACSADVGNLKGHKTFGSIPNFPHIAGAFVVEGFNSTQCGACYELSYKRADGTVVVVPFTIINSAPFGFTSSLQGMEDLTGLTPSTFPGNATISYRRVPIAECGF